MKGVPRSPDGSASWCLTRDCTPRLCYHFVPGGGAALEPFSGLPAGDASILKGLAKACHPAAKAIMQIKTKLSRPSAPCPPPMRIFCADPPTERLEFTQVVQAADASFCHAVTSNPAKPTINAILRSVDVEASGQRRVGSRGETFVSATRSTRNREIGIAFDMHEP